MMAYCVLKTTLKKISYPLVIHFSVIMKKYLRIIFWLSLICTLWSLYVEHFGDPLANIISGDLWNQSLGIVACNLCRYIRVFTYPIVLLSAVGLLFNDKSAGRYIFSLAFVCLFFCIYKFGLEMKWWSDWSNPFLCVTWTADCAEAKPVYGWFITLSLMGIIANFVFLYCSAKLANFRTLH